MNNPIQDEPEMKELERETSFGSAEGVKTNEGTSMSMKDPDTMVSMIVLLITCLALAALAHVFV